MTRNARLFACVLLVMATALIASCESGGIGVGVNGGSGARWGAGGPGPDVFVGGGPGF
jgi:hypothetical protein